MKETTSALSRALFRAIHEGRWLSVEYKNQRGETTHYWFGITNVRRHTKSDEIVIEGKCLDLRSKKVGADYTILLSRIQSAHIVDGTYMPQNKALIDDIKVNPERYGFLFAGGANLKVLNYLSDCNRLEGTPHLDTDFHLVQKFDDDTAEGNLPYRLSDAQFSALVDAFKKDTDRKAKFGAKETKQLALNKLSLNTPRGLYVLAYREMLFDVAERTLRPSDSVSFNKEFAFSEKAGKAERESITRFLDAENLPLLSDFEKNRDEIASIVQSRISSKQAVDEMPYFLCLERSMNLDLEKEYESILKMYEENAVTVPIRAFFGELNRIEPSENPAPIALLNSRVNLDQLLSIYNAMNYPVSYIQGPPGTGKTNTILNTIVTAFFNSRTVLFASYNNHPIDTVFDTLTSLKYHRMNGTDSVIPFPILRLGNNEKVAEAIEYIKNLYGRVKDEKIFSGTLLRNRDEKIEATRKLVALLKRHQESVDLRERKDTLESLIENEGASMEFALAVEGEQLTLIKNRLSEIGTITDRDALELLQNDEDFIKYVHFTSASLVQNIRNPEYERLREILEMPRGEKQVAEFNRYTAEGENVLLLQKIFPIIATTCISSHKIGGAGPLFDMTIIDEASQCNTAVSLVPIIRGRSLMLVGDPQQLNPVITLDEETNRSLKAKYSVSDDYDYITHSVYKAFLANDAVSGEILLHNHYRCAKEIIEFNNRKYYGGQLNVMSERRIPEPLSFCDVKDSGENVRNSSQAEAEKVVSLIRENPEKSIGIITPFRNQKELIEENLREAGLDAAKYPCGTVHAFQGDEKDTVIFSLALTKRTQGRTYEWLKNNRELINVATSRAKDRLLLVADSGEIERLHKETADGRENRDDLYELSRYVRQNGKYEISPCETNSRALGTKPFKTETEQAFLTTLNHAISNIITNGTKFTVHSEVPIAQVFAENVTNSDFFYKGRFDFVIYRIGFRKKEIPVLAIELNGREHYEDEQVKRRDAQKLEICRAHGFELIQVENSYARRYNFVKEILTEYFGRI